MKNNGSWLAALALAAAMPVAADDWSAWIVVDRFTGDEEMFAVYTVADPQKPRPSVYAGIVGSLNIHCSGGTAFFRLDDPEGYMVEFLPHGTEDRIEISTRFDNETVQELSAYTSGGRAILSFDRNLDMLSLAEGRRRVLMEVPSVKGSLYFDFSLTGLHEAHRENCG